MITKKQVAILKACEAKYRRIVKENDKAMIRPDVKELERTERAMSKLQNEYKRLLLDIVADAMAD